MKTRDQSRKLHLVLERVSSLFRSQLREAAAQHGLKLVQLEALIYLSTANRYSDTSGSVAEYLGITKGTASQSVMALEKHGLIDKRRDAVDGRVVHIDLTSEGRKIVQSSHPVAFLGELSERNLENAEHAAVELLRALQSAHDFQTFGQCRSCKHLEKRGRQLSCGLTSERLTSAETLLICRDHAVAAR